MGNSPEPNEKSKNDEFDPWLGLALGDTWWKIGKNFATILNVDGEKRQQNLEKWAVDVRKELAEDDMREAIEGVTPEAILQFISTVMKLLENKFDSKDIRADVSRLMQSSSKYNIYDTGQYLDFQEPPDTFWAAEYRFLLLDLDGARKGGGWLNAVARCADPECNVFFIKSRTDQRHHTPACRTRSANRQAYAEKSGQRHHTKRGRPRLSR